MEGMSLLPMIKCSSCGVDIDISQLADHVCATTAPNDNVPLSPKLDRAATFGGAPTQKKPQSRGPPPLRVDPYAANKPFGVYNSPISPSPLSPGDRKFNRSATSPLPRPNAPPSPDLRGNMDSPFPMLPKKKNSPSTSLKPRPLDRAAPYYAQEYAQPSPLFAPLSPRTDGGANVLKRMDTIAPGPFDGQGYDRRPSTSNGPRPSPSDFAQGGHRRTDTQNSLRDASDRRTSMSSTGSRGSVFSQGGSGLPPRSKPGMSGTMLPPPVPPMQVEDKTEGIDAFLERLQKETMGPQKNRSKSPMPQNNRSASQDRSRSPMRPDMEQQTRPDAPRATSRRPPPSIRTSGSPMRSHQANLSVSSIRSTSTDKDLPALPQGLNLGRDGQPDTIYTPSDSGRSEDSYGSGRSAASSRSSPPTSEAAHSRQASKISRPDYMVDEPLQRTLSPDSYADSRAAPSMRPNVRRANDDYNNRSRTPEALLRPPQMPEPPQTPMDPAIQRGLAYEKRQDARTPRDPALNFGVRPPSPRIPSPEPVQKLQRRPTGANRGKCRGCGEVIIGKSVKDSSGRLTGRYHKECFVCHTCRDPFPTAEFYVFENSPYCHQHYHTLNGSLCRTCDRGIEGQYLETDQKLKYHPKCFTCFTCRIVLRDDYYELGRRNYCERHAYAAVNQRNQMLGAPNDQNKKLEKRRTRMMMMR